MSNASSNAPIDPVPSHLDPRGRIEGFPRGAGGSGSEAGVIPEPHQKPPGLSASLGGSDGGLEAYAASLGIGAGYTPVDLPALTRQYGPTVLRLCLDFAHDERHQRLDVLLGRRLPYLLHRVHKLGVHLGRNYGFECPCGRRW